MIQNFIKTCYQVCYQLLLVYELLIRPKIDKWWKNLLDFRNFGKASNSEIENSLKLQKIPVHLAVSIWCESMGNFNENGNVNLKVYLDKIAEIASWASRFNIKYLSFYDPEGVLKSHSKILSQHLNEKFQHSCIDKAGRIIVANNTSLNKNEFIEDHLTIFIRCRQDGKKLLLQAIRDIYLEKKLKSDPSKQLTNDLFDDNLNKIMYSNLWEDMDKRSTLKTEPDLLMIMGETKSLMGFLPWHIRNTEIHALPNLLDLDYSNFEMSIRNFANCEQRFGK